LPRELNIFLGLTTIPAELARISYQEGKGLVTLLWHSDLHPHSKVIKLLLTHAASQLELIYASVHVCLLLS